MKESHRISRVEREIQQILAQFILRSVRFPQGLLVTVTRIECTKELRTAKVHISFMGDAKLQDEAMEILDENRSLIQHHLNKEMHMKFVPRVSFHLDKGLEHMMHIQSVLDGVNKQKDEE